MQCLFQRRHAYFLCPFWHYFTLSSLTWYGKKKQVFQCKACFVRIPYFGITDKLKSGVCPKSSFEVVSTLHPCSDVPGLHLGWGMECVVLRVGQEHPVLHRGQSVMEGLCGQGFFTCWPLSQPAFILRPLVSCLKKPFHWSRGWLNDTSEIQNQSKEIRNKNA